MPEHGAAVAVGGAVGSVGRVLVPAVVPGVLGTLLVNVSGAFLLGLLLARTDDARTRALLGTGVLGAWTTFSTFVVEVEQLVHVQPALAGAYLLTSVAAGLLAARVGRRAEA